MPRVLILCRRPFHLSTEEAERWIQTEASRLLADDDLTRIRFTALQSASEALPRSTDWLLEIDLADDSDPAAAVQGPACRDLLGDLRLLGMRPSVLVAGASVDIAAGQ